MFLRFPFYLEELTNVLRLLPPKEQLVEDLPDLRVDSNASRLMPPKEQLVVSDKLLEDLADLRVDYARLLCEYKNVLKSSPEAEKNFVDTLPRLLGKSSLGPNHSFESYFNKLVDEEVSLFNITYLKSLCRIFPADVK